MANSGTVMRVSYGVVSIYTRFRATEPKAQTNEHYRPERLITNRNLASMDTTRLTLPKHKLTITKGQDTSQHKYCPMQDFLCRRGWVLHQLQYNG